MAPVAVARTAGPAAVPFIGSGPAVEAHPTISDSLGTGNPSGALVSIAATPNAAAVGDFVIVQFAWAAATTALSTVTDTAGNTWTVVSTPATNECGGYGFTTVTTGWASGANTVTGTLASGAPGGRVWTAVSIPAAYNPVLDQHNESAPTTDQVRLSTTSLAQVAEVVFIIDLGRSTTGALPTWNWVNGFSGLTSINGVATTASGCAIGVYDNLDGTNAVTGGFNNVNASNGHGSSIMAVSVTTTVPATVTPRPIQVVQQPAPRPAMLGRFSRIVAPSVQLAAATAAGGAPIVTPLVTSHVQAAQLSARRPRHGGIVQSRWPGYQWAGLAPVTPLIEPHVQSLVPPVEERRHVRGAVIAPDVQSAAAPSQPKPSQVTVLQAVQMATRRAHHGGIVQSRWPGYEWVGLAPVTPTPRQVVQDQAAVWQAREDHRRGLIVAPPVQAAAAIAGTAPVVPPLPKQVVVARAAFQPRRTQHGGRVAEPGVQLAAAVAPPPPLVTPLRTVFVVQAAQQSRQHRRGTVTAPRPVQGVTTRPIASVVTARPPSVQTRRHGCVTAPRRVTAPIAPPRPVVVHPTPLRRRRGGSVTALHGRFVQTGGPTTLITTPLTGLVAAGDRGFVATGDTAQPPAGDTGTVKAGNTGFPQI